MFSKVSELLSSVLAATTILEQVIFRISEPARFVAFESREFKCFWFVLIVVVVFGMNNLKLKYI